MDYRGRKQARAQADTEVRLHKRGRELNGLKAGQLGLQRHTGAGRRKTGNGQRYCTPGRDESAWFTRRERCSEAARDLKQCH